MAVQKSNNVFTSGGVTKDDLLISYGRIQGAIVGGFIYRQLVNTNYSTDPVRGGTVKVRRLKMSTTQAYGTARAAEAGDAIQNNGVDVVIDTDREIAEEMNAKDMRLYQEGGELAILQSRESDFALSMGVELETAYFTTLQLAATANGLVNLSGVSGVEEKAALLIQTLEALTGENVSKVDRSLMVLTLAPKWFDALEKYTQTLPNPLNNGVNARFFRRVEIQPAVRQGFDAVIQVRGSLAQPVVMGDFEIQDIPLSADKAAYMPYFYGTKAIMPELVLAGAFDSDISV